ncbi:uncharacterized protein LOC115327173 [Ixodes scapularis]|uniref:uncharacterized protein LOC115327173 n=1 Tax=Ixodes scapularis TaxID=6945 RepID=UPI001C390CA3|nr:uncharacterized protein LOC115327173 [Ixodes scapularis]
MDLGARVMPTLVLPAGTNERLREYWCIRWVDSMSPGLASIPLADVLQKRWTNSLGKPPTAVPIIKFISKQVKSLASSIERSHALSTSSSEKSRVGQLEKLQHLKYVILFANNKTGAHELDEQFLEETHGKFHRAENVDYKNVLAIRQTTMQKYWKLLSPNPEFRYLIVRHPMAMTDNYGSYDYGSNTMYVSGGQLRPYYFKDSSVYMLNYARIGFYMGATLLKTMDMKGGHFKPGYNHPINWRGVYAMERTKEIHDCLQEGKNMSNARKAVMMTNAFTPGFRFFRTMALERAYPKPEYRVDKFPEFSMADLYFFSVVQNQRGG